RRGRLRVGMIDAAAVGHHPEVLRRFRRAHPDVELRLAVAPSGALLDGLRAGSTDLVVCVDPAATGDAAPDLVVTPLLEESLTVYGPQVAPPSRRRVDPS